MSSTIKAFIGITVSFLFITTLFATGHGGFRAVRPSLNFISGQR